MALLDRKATAPEYARAIADALTSKDGTVERRDVVLDPLTGKPAGVFVVACRFGRFVITVAELAE